MLRRLVGLFGVCSLLVVLVGPASADEPSIKELNRQLEKLEEKSQQVQSDLQNTRKRRRQARKKLSDKERKENNLLGLIERYRKLQHQTKKRLNQLRNREKRAQKQLEKIDARLRNVKRNLKSRENILKSRLRDIYKQGQLMQTKMVVKSRNVSDLITNYRYYRQLVEHDQGLISDYQETKQELQKLREQRQNIYERRKAIRKDVESTLSKREEIIKSREEFLQNVREKKNLYQRRLEELRQRQNKLKEKVFRFQQRRSEAKQKLERISGKFGKRKGELPWPVKSREILRPYGSWRENGIVHQNDGIDIGVDQAASVRAVAPGRVVFADEYQGIGKVVIVRHSDSFISLYGSLVEVNVARKDKVNVGSLLGRAGRTPGMDRSRLYFQVFQGKETLNPAEWLK